MKFLVIGAGAVGAFYAGKLSQAGGKIYALCRSDYEIVRAKGFEIKSPLGDFNYKPTQTINRITDCDEEFDYIIVATKVLPDLDVSELIKKVIKPKTAIVLLQNGIHIEERIATNFPQNEIISGIAFIGVSKLKGGTILHQEYGNLILGNFPNGISSKTTTLAELWRKSGIATEISEQILRERWKKLVWNAAFNPISVLSGGLNTKQILENTNCYQLAINVMKEVSMLAMLDNCKLPDDVIENNIESTKKMKPYKTSMLLDFESKRKMEIEAILGNAISFAKNKNIATPYLSTLYALLSCF